MRFEVKNGCFSYPKGAEVLSHVSFTAEEGSIVSILGPNGVGKTTLVKCMLGFLKWKEGQTLMDGREVGSIPSKELWQKIAYVPQAKSVMFPMSCEEMVLLGRSAYLGLFSVPGKVDRSAAERAMELAGIGHLRDKSCSEISGGELQLVLIARALAAQPKLLILDEPETGLDFRNQLIVLNLIEKLSREEGISAILNTHYPEHAISISAKTLLLRRDGTSLFGAAGETLTPDNMRSTFGVEVSMREEEIRGKRYFSVIPVAITA